MPRNSTVDRIKQLLIKKHSRPPQFVNAREFDAYLDHTIIRRLRAAETAASELRSLLKDLREAAVGKRGKRSLDLAIAKVDAVVSGPQHGMLYYNRTFSVQPEGDPIKLIWADRRGSSAKRRSKRGRRTGGK